MRDIAGAWLSFLCILHCILPVILLAGGATFGLDQMAEGFHAAWLHMVLLVPVVAILAISIPKAYRTHGNAQPAVIAVVGVLTLVFGVTLGEQFESWFTVLGSFFVILSHLLNRKILKNNNLVLAHS